MDWLEHALKHNVGEVISTEELKNKIKSGKQLRIKFGVDVTNPLIHIGHAVNLWKMREFQERGHRVVFLIGDFTTLIGDPTGKSKTRPMRTAEEIKKDAAAYISQVTKVLLKDPNVFEVRRNSEWFAKMNLGEFFKLCGRVTHSKLIQRDMFQKRMAENSEIYAHELLYPILQGYDSYMLNSDLTIIGSDQLFNELLGRHYQKVFGQEPQVVMTTVITPGIDGKEKMSKSLGNFIAITDAPENKFGKIMTLPDDLIVAYYRVYTKIDSKIIDNYERQLSAGANPRDIKLKLGRDLVALYDGEAAANQARENFLKIFSKKEKPEEMPTLKITNYALRITDLLLEAGVKSKSEARRLIEQGGVKINDEIKKDVDEILSLKSGDILRIGKRKFFKLT